MTEHQGRSVCPLTDEELRQHVEFGLRLSWLAEGAWMEGRAHGFVAEGGDPEMVIERLVAQMRERPEVAVGSSAGQGRPKVPEGHSEASRKQRCEQCGREGTRGFKTLGPTVVDWLGDPFTLAAITVCANSTACQKRWPKASDDELERMYAA